MRRSSKPPAGPGLYWLALDNGNGDWEPPFALLVEVTIEPIYGDVRITTVNHPLNAALGRCSIEAPSLSDLGNGAIRRMSVKGSVFGMIGTEHHRDMRLTWLGAVKPPKMPEYSYAD